jgi:hypothetical protein
MARWQAETGNKVPTLYAAACFLTFHGVTCAFPSRVLLQPFLPWVRRRAKALYNKRPHPYIRSMELNKAIYERKVKFARPSSDYLMSTGEEVNPNGIYGWGIADMRKLYDLIPEALQRELVESVPGVNTAKANAVLSPDTLTVLRKFELEKWRRYTEESELCAGTGFKAINLLWIQVVLLDIAIQFLIRGGWSFRSRPLVHHDNDEDNERKLNERLYNETWGEKEAQAAASVVDAWRPGDVGQIENPADVILGDFSDSEDDDPDWTGLGGQLRDWDLAGALENNPYVFQGLSVATRKNNCQRLAELLELRAIFLIALLYMHPDSSDVYVIERQDIEMPMA